MVGPSDPFAQLLHAVKLALDRSDSVGWSELNALDWEEVIKQGYTHGALPLVASLVARHRGDASDDPLVQTLFEYPRRVRAKNKFLSHELVRVQNWLSERSVRSVTFKGPVLAATAYGGLERRTCTDIDLLISPRTLSAAEDSLIENGYQLTGPSRGFWGRRSSGFFGRQYSLVRGDGVFHVDLHTSIVSPFYSYTFDFEDLWSRSLTVEVEGIPIRSLAPSNMLLAVCHQGLKDRWRRLKHVIDVATLVPLIGDHWPKLIQRTREVGAQRTLFLGLYLAGRLLDVALPSRVDQRVFDDRRVDRLGRSIIKDLPNLTDDPEESFLGRVRLYTLIHDTFGGAARYAALSVLRKLWYVADQSFTRN